MEKLVLHKVGAEGWGKTDQTRLDIRIIIFHNYVSMYTIFVCCMISMSMYTYIYICMQVHVHVYVYAHPYAYAYGFGCVYVLYECICMYLYVCACTYLYVYSVIHIRDHRDAAFPQSRAFASKHEPRPWSQRSFFGSTT